MIEIKRMTRQNKNALLNSFIGLKSSPKEYILELIKNKTMNMDTIIKKFTKYKLPEPWYIVTVLSCDQESDSALFGTENMCYKVHLFPTVTTDYNPTVQVASVTFKDNLGFKFERQEDVYNVDNVHLVFPPEKPFLSYIPKSYDQEPERNYFQVLILPFKDNLHKVDELHFFGFDEQHQDYLVEEEYNRVQNLYGLDSLKSYDNHNYWPGSYKTTCENYEYYMYNNEVKVYPLAYKGGYIPYDSQTDTCFNSSSVHLSGPMGKFYK